MLFTTLAFAHLLHHYFINAGEAAHSPPFFLILAYPHKRRYVIADTVVSIQFAVRLQSIKSALRCSTEQKERPGSLHVVENTLEGVFESPLSHQ